jgi:hypothetical protein
MTDDKKLETAFNFGAAPPSETEKRAFFRAAEENDIRALRKILADWPEAAETWRNYSHQTVISAACAKLKPETLKFLLAHKAPIEDYGTEEHKAWSALQTMAFQGNVGQAEMLLRHGANPDACDQYGMTPLMYAAKNNKPACVDLLVLVGADPDRRDTLYRKSAFENCDSEELREVIRFAQKKRADFLAAVAAQDASPAPAASDKSWVRKLF